MLYCGFCGTALADNASFCEHCGQKTSNNEEGSTTQVFHSPGAAPAPLPPTLISPSRGVPGNQSQTTPVLRSSGATPTPLPPTLISQNNTALSNQPPTNPRTPRLLIALLVVLLVIIVSMGTILYTTWHASSNVPTATPTPAYPAVAGQYQGTIDNTIMNVQTTLALAIYQAQGNLNGTATVGPALIGSGPLTGVIDTAGNIQFKVRNAQLNEPLSFSGTVQPGGGLSGTYCGVNEQNQCDSNGGKGTWSVTRSSS